MHYRIRGLTIRSENAAKTPREVSRPLAEWLERNIHVGAALDYGCGRLRYTPYLARCCETLGLVDSLDQLDRTTRIAGRLTNIRAHAMRKWPGCRVYSVEEFWGGVRERYDFVLCANVLSAIPSQGIRSRSLRAIHGCLSRSGTILVVNQHTNSYFTEAGNKSNSVLHLDGWILRSTRGPAYFGILRRDKINRLLRAHGFHVQDGWIEGQSNYVLAGR
jgi:Methyltransferase domain